MIKQSYLNTVLFGGVAIAIASFLATPATANPNPTEQRGTESVQQPQPSSQTDFLLAQSSLIGQCRKVNWFLGIYQGPADTTGTRIDVLQAGAVVRLADGGNGKGWIKIDYPQTGYVQAGGLAFLASCPPYVDGGGNKNLCRKVERPPEGLLVRREPNSSSEPVGGVAQGAQVTLTTNPPTARKDAAGRTWIEISAPRSGWVSNGLPGNPTNLVYCSGSTPPPPPPPPPANRCRRVIRPPEGLTIKKAPSVNAATVGSVGLYQRVTLTTIPPTVNKEPEGRTWVQIEAPVPGWVSNGFSGSNLGYCQ